MLKMVHQLTLAGLALVLFGGLLSPVLAQAASTDAGGTETTNTSSTTTNYPISSIDGLYATYLSANGSKKVYAFPQDPKSYTKADKSFGFVAVRDGEFGADLTATKISGPCLGEA